VTLRSELQDIASELGLTREALYRTLAGLERAGTIERAGDRILLKKSLGPAETTPEPRTSTGAIIAR
jgi:DNA-binding IclR family transcriptional regulator